MQEIEDMKNNEEKFLGLENLKSSFFSKLDSDLKIIFDQEQIENDKSFLNEKVNDFSLFIEEQKNKLQIEIANEREKLLKIKDLTFRKLMEKHSENSIKIYSDFLENELLKVKNILLKK